MSRKVFLSILGTSFYESCTYVYGEFSSSETRFAQQATLEYIRVKDWSKDDIAIFPLTKKAFSENWNREERVKPGTNEMVPYKGLKNILEDMKLPLKVKPVDIPDGKDEKEMWQIFKIIYEELETGDELYIDLTHSFRYLPMLLLVLSNYAKFLKKTSVKSLTYGNFEARNRELNEAPISDLLPIVALQDWTIAAAGFVSNGDIKALKQLSESTLNPILRVVGNSNQEVLNIRNLIKNIEKTVMDFQTCRGLNIIKASNISTFRNNYHKLKTTFIEPLNPIIETIDASFNDFDDKENIENGFHAAQWCFDNGLYQQAVTILQENVISFFCDKYGIPIDNENGRERLVKRALIFAKNQEVEIEPEFQEDKLIGDDCSELVNVGMIDHIEPEKGDLSDDEQYLLDQLMKDELLKAVAGDYRSLSTTRNDINHSGMRSSKKPQSPDKLIRNIERNMNTIFKKIINAK